MIVKFIVSPWKAASLMSTQHKYKYKYKHDLLLRYSWWSSFFAHCIRKLPGWWEVKSSITGRESGTASSFEAMVMPYVFPYHHANQLKPFFIVT